MGQWNIIGYRGGEPVQWGRGADPFNGITITRERWKSVSGGPFGIRFVVRAPNVTWEHRALTLDAAKDYAGFRAERT